MQPAGPNSANDQILALTTQVLQINNQISSSLVTLNGAIVAVNDRVTDLENRGVAAYNHINQRVNNIALNQSELQDRETIRTVREGLLEIDRKRVTEQWNLGAKVVALSAAVAGVSGAAIASVAAIPFQPEVAFALIPITTTLAAVAGALRVVDVEWRGMKNMPSAEIQQIAKENEMFPGQDIDAQKKKAAYDSLVEEEGRRITKTANTVRESEDSILANVGVVRDMVNNVAGRNAPTTDLRQPSR